jgi:hypothetical protein
MSEYRLEVDGKSVMGWDAALGRDYWRGRYEGNRSAAAVLSLCLGDGPWRIVAQGTLEDFTQWRELPVWEVKFEDGLSQFWRGACSQEALASNLQLKAPKQRVSLLRNDVEVASGTVEAVLKSGLPLAFLDCFAPRVEKPPVGASGAGRFRLTVNHLPSVSWDAALGPVGQQWFKADERPARLEFEEAHAPGVWRIVARGTLKDLECPYSLPRWTVALDTRVLGWNSREFWPSDLASVLDGEDPESEVSFAYEGSELCKTPVFRLLRAGCSTPLPVGYEWDYDRGVARPVLPAQMESTGCALIDFLPQEVLDALRPAPYQVRAIASVCRNSGEGFGEHREYLAEIKAPANGAFEDLPRLLAEAKAALLAQWDQFERDVLGRADAAEAAARRGEA